MKKNKQVYVGLSADILHEVEEHTLDTPRVCISLNLKLTGKIGKPIY